MKESTLAYETLPVVDWAQWSHSGTQHAGMWPVATGDDGTTQAMVPDGEPTVKAVDATALSISQPLRGGGKFSMVCREGDLACSATDGNGRPLRWAFDVVGGQRLAATVTGVSADAVACSAIGAKYEVKLGAGHARAIAPGHLRLTADDAGKLVLRLQQRE